MPEVSLQSYGDEMRQMIAAGSCAQAISIGRHILGLHPKHLYTYRILGEAFLEQGDFAEAHGLFARALSCDPEDLLARAGIAVAHEKRGNQRLAIWHLERAYDLAPSNPELRKELQRLYAFSDSTPRTRLKLTPTAVARLYARSGLWRQAIQEFRSLLRENPDLLDIKVALAEALWNDGQKTEASKTCQEILQTYPHCLKANLILGEIGLRGERESEGRALLQLAQEIDPENTMAQRLFGDRSPLPARIVKVPRLQDVPAPPPASEVSLHEEMVPEAALPDWLAATPLKPTAEPVEEAAATEEAMLSPEGEQIAATQAADELAEDAEEGIPDWLQRIRERQRQDIQPETRQPSETIQEAAPDWLARLREEQSRSDTQLAGPQPAETLPIEVAPSDIVETPEATDTPEKGVPDWLQQLETEAETAPAPAEPPTEPEAKPEPLPDWLTAGLAASEGTAVAATKALLPEGEDVEMEALLAQPEVPPSEEVAVEISAAPVVEMPLDKSSVAEPPAVKIAAEVPVESEPAKGMPTEESSVSEPAAAEVAAEPAPAAPAEVVSPEQTLARAREMRDSADADSALNLYEQLIREGHLLDKVLADLEGEAAGLLAQSRTYTLIGDLCMKQDRLQKALEAYRRALGFLKQ